jgi:hypothetical protein
LADTDNYGFRSYAAPEELVTPATVTPGSLPSGLVPARSTTDKKQDKQNARDIINMALLGGIADPLAGQLIKGLDKLFPALDLMTELEEMQEEAIPEGLSDIDRAEIERSRAIGEAVVPRPKVKGKVLTPRGKIAKGALSTLPGYAAKTPTGAKAFADVKSAVTTAEGAVSAARIKARGDVEEKRIGVERASLERTRTPVIFNGATLGKDGKLHAFVRTGVTIGDTRWVLSQGDPEIDQQLDGTKIKRGKYYQNSRHTLIPGERKDPTGVNLVNTTDNGPRRAKSLWYDEVDDKGRRRIRIEVALPDNDTMVPIEDAPGIWMLEPPGGTYKPKDYPGEVDQVASDFWKGVHNSQEITLQAALGAIPLLEMADEDDPNYNPAAFTDASLLARGLVYMQDNIDTITHTLGGKAAENRFYENIFREKRDDDDGQVRNGHTSLLLRAAVGEYREAIRNKASQSIIDEKREHFLRLVKRLKMSSTRQSTRGTDNGVFKWFDAIEDDVRGISEDRALRMAIQLELAYAAAAAQGQTGRTLSDRDVANFLQMVGFGNNDSREVRRLVTEFMWDRFVEFDTTNATLMNLQLDQDERDIYLQGTLKLTDAHLRDKMSGGTQISGKTGGYADPFWDYDDKLGHIYRPWHKRAENNVISAPYLGPKGYFQRFLKKDLEKYLTGAAEAKIRKPVEPVEPGSARARGQNIVPI